MLVLEWSWKVGKPRISPITQKYGVKYSGFENISIGEIINIKTTLDVSLCPLLRAKLVNFLVSGVADC